MQMSNITDRLNKITQTLNSHAIATYAHKRFIEHTPVKSGNARRKTTLKGNIIEANYPYAERLENNYSSQTHGKGIVNPTINDVRNYVHQKTGIKIR